MKSESDKINSISFRKFLLNSYFYFIRIVLISVNENPIFIQNNILLLNFYFLQNQILIK